MNKFGLPNHSFRESISMGFKVIHIINKKGFKIQLAGFFIKSITGIHNFGQSRKIFKCMINQEMIVDHIDLGLFFIIFGKWDNVFLNRSIHGENIRFDRFIVNQGLIHHKYLFRLAHEVVNRLRLGLLLLNIGKMSLYVLFFSCGHQSLQRCLKISIEGNFCVARQHPLNDQIVERVSIEGDFH